MIIIYTIFDIYFILKLSIFFVKYLDVKKRYIFFFIDINY